MTPRLFLAPILAAMLSAAIFVAPAHAAKLRVEDTIKSLEKKEIQLRPGRAIMESANLARENYRTFLDLMSDDPELRAEAMRRLGDLELEATEAEQLADNIDALDYTVYDDTVTLYQQLLEAYPDYRRNDTVLYQLARAYEIGGQNDAALRVLDELVGKYPHTLLIDEVQFRRGEMLFLRRRYNDAERAYQDVVKYGSASRFYEQSLYKLGWSQFKLAWHEQSLTPFFELIDRKIGNIELAPGEERLQSLRRSEQELVEDTFRVLSISFSYLQGAETINSFLDGRGRPHYSYVIYRNLGDLYLEQERYQDAAQAYEAFVVFDPHHAKAPLLQVEVIQAYERGGFPSLVLEGKKDFVARYGMDGDFWLHNPREQNTEVAANLKA
ncbi:MAG: tetratricopeptide repeat protein, partial [Proteobacteria bacterium]|nr:tetratricopeptide repeat protein [Pseudomonadota bacterium]